jgi:hypothetical protein
MMLCCNFLKLTSGLSRNSFDSRNVKVVHPISLLFMKLMHGQVDYLDRAVEQ